MAVFPGRQQCGLTTRSKTDARKHRCAPLLAPFNANVRVLTNDALLAKLNAALSETSDVYVNAGVDAMNTSKVCEKASKSTSARLTWCSRPSWHLDFRTSSPGRRSAATV